MFKKDVSSLLYLPLVGCSPLFPSVASLSVCFFSPAFLPLGGRLPLRFSPAVGVFFWGLLPRLWQCGPLSFCSELFMKLIECSVEGLTAYLKTLAADDPKVQMVELLLEELKAK
jgi:hypothetical protein